MPGFSALVLAPVPRLSRLVFVLKRVWVVTVGSFSDLFTFIDLLLVSYWF